jgi:hypothetical protein
MNVESENLELDAEIAQFMRLPEVQPGHMAYWYSTVERCGWTAYSGPPVNRDHAAHQDKPCYVYHWGPETTDICVRDNGLREIPHYSEDFNAAFQVVEYVRELGYWFCLFDMRSEPVDWRKWRASFCEIAAPKEPIDGLGRTVPAAICIAAAKIAQILESQDNALARLIARELDVAEVIP